MLKESWTGERDMLLHLNKPVDDYMVDLGDKLDAVADLTTSHADRTQQNYADPYNLHARDKHFKECDLVVLAADNAGKLCPHWVGPVTIVKVKSPYSYLVDMGNAQVRHIHANKIRKFIARVHGCGVISDRDMEFGRVLQPVSVVCDSKPSERVSADRLTHLSDEQRDDLLSVLDKFAICFSDRPGLYTWAVHRIETTAKFKPKRMRAFRKCSSQTWRNRLVNSWTWGSSDRPSARWPVQSFVWPKKWRGTFGCGLSLLKFIYSSRCLPDGHGK